MAIRRGQKPNAQQRRTAPRKSAPAAKAARPPQVEVQVEVQGKVQGKTLSGPLLDKLDELVAGRGDGRVSRDDVSAQLRPLLAKDGALSTLERDTLEHALSTLRFTPEAKVALTDALRDLGQTGLLEGTLVDRFEKVALPSAQKLSAEDVKLARAVLREMSQGLGARDEQTVLDRVAKISTLATQASRPAGGLEEVGVKRQADDVSAAMTRTYGAMGDLLYIPSADALVERLPEIRQQAVSVSQFRKELSSSSSLNELRGLGRRWAGQRLPGQCLNELLQAMMSKTRGKDATAFGEAAKFWEEAAAQSPGYPADQIGRELYIVCLNKAGRIDDSIAEARAYIDDLTGKPDLSISPDTVRDEPRLNGEVLAAAGKAIKLFADRAAKGEAPPPKVQELLLRELGLDAAPAGFDWGKAALDVSTNYYEAGFTRDFEYYPGIVSVYQNYERGDDKRAEALAPMVYAACEAAGGKESSDYWCLATQMELSLILGRDQDFADILPKVLEQADVGWMLSSTVDKMTTLAGQREAAGGDAKALRFAIGTLSERVAELDNPTGVDVAEWIGKTRANLQRTLGTRDVGASAPTQAQQQAKARTDAVLNSTADFRALTNSHAVGGNVAYGGQIPDMTVTRQSVRVVRDLLQEWGLDDVADFETWNKTVNGKLNDIFELQDKDGRRPLEDLHSHEHEVLDAYDRTRFALAATDDSGDSRTDLLAVMALGIGDCRPTGYAKQLLFDVWQHDRKNTLLQQAFDATTSGDRPTFDARMGAVKDLEKVQLRTITCQIDAPVQMREMYDWVTDDAGRPRRDPEGKYNAVENHTFNVLLRFDDDGNVEDNVRASDGFYQQLYPLDGMALSASELVETGGFSGEKMGTTADDGDAIPFRLMPASYSGALLKEFDVGSTDFRYCGQSVAPPTVATMLFERLRLNGFARSIAALSPDALAADKSS